MPFTFTEWEVEWTGTGYTSYTHHDDNSGLGWSSYTTNCTSAVDLGTDEAVQFKDIAIWVR